MPDIRYVCLSDTHFGEEDSLLTNLKTASMDTDPGQPSPVAKNLVKCLADLISRNEDPSRKPTLILNGDILELALCEINEAAMAFERFVELILAPGEELFDQIILIPGNHDHHLWESARETQYVEYIGSIKPGKLLPIPWHTTNMFLEEDPSPLASYFLTRLVRRYRHLKKRSVYVSYPNLGLYQDFGRCVVFHHGHFTEPLYMLMSKLRTMIFPGREKPRNIWDIEAENFAWIDFFWSALGRSGGAGRDVELLYEKMQDIERFKKLLYNLADSLAKEYDLPGWGDVMEAKILRFIIRAAVDRAVKTERTFTERALSPEGEKGLWDYMNGPLKEQILIERSGNMPRDMTFVFGHTHKPFQEDMNFKHYPEWVNVYNTGGWVVETVDAEPAHGAAAVLIDEMLNVAALRLYNEKADPADYQVSVEEAVHGDEKKNPFYLKIKALVKPSEEPWSDFSEAVSRAVRVRAQNLRARINEKD